MVSERKKRSDKRDASEPSSEPIYYRGQRQPGLEFNRDNLQSTWTANGHCRTLHPGERWGSLRDLQLCDLVTQRRRLRLSPAEVVDLVASEDRFAHLRGMFSPAAVADWAARPRWEDWPEAVGAHNDGETTADDHVALCGRIWGVWAGGWFVTGNRTTGEENAPQGESERFRPYGKMPHEQTEAEFDQTQGG